MMQLYLKKNSIHMDTTYEMIDVLCEICVYLFVDMYSYVCMYRDVQYY